MVCLECGRNLRNLTFSHLRACCGLTPAQYRQRHPGAELIDADVRSSFGLPLERNPKWKGGKTHRRCKECGKRLHKNARGLHCARCRIRTGEMNSFHGKKHTPETRARMRASAAHRDPTTYVGKGLSSAEISAIQKRHWSRLSRDEKTSRLATFIAAGQKYNRKASKTRIEKTVAAALAALGIQCERKVQIGRYNVDILVPPRLVIECFGDFWHCNPELYAPDDYNGSLRCNASEKWGRDAARVRALAADGYEVHVLWERVILGDEGGLLDILRQIFGLD